MYCWKCGMKINDGSTECIYCHTNQRRSVPTTEVGKGMRQLYDYYGAEDVLNNPTLLSNGIGDMINDTVGTKVNRLKNLLKMAMDAGFGRLYKEQLLGGKPDNNFYTRAISILTEDVGLNDKIASELITYFDEMIGWQNEPDVQLKLDHNSIIKTQYFEEENDRPFMMPIEDAFSIKGRGTVVTGRIERGAIKVSDPVEIIGLGEKSKYSVCTGIEMYHKIVWQAEAGDHLGLLLRGIERTDVERGMVVAKPGSIHPHTKFKAQVYILKHEEGGRHKPFTKSEHPKFYIRTVDVTGNISLPEDIEMVMPGDNVVMEVELIVPVALEKGSKFAIREGGLTIGVGTVTEIIS